MFGREHMKAIATPKHREVWRNVALITWLLGVAPNILAAVFLHAATPVFAVIVVVSAIFLIISCMFCFANMQTLAKKKIFYLICLVILAASTSLAAAMLAQTPGTNYTFRIVGFVGCGLHAISCLSFVVLNILLHIRGPLDPVECDGESAGDVPEQLANSIIHVRYVRAQRGRRQRTFRAEGGQIIRVPRARVGGSLAAGQPRELPGTDQCTIRTISHFSLGSQRRESSISLLRRTSETSVEYETGPSGCTCYYTPSQQNADDDDLPPYTQAATGNISACPIHSMAPPPYDGMSAYVNLCMVLGLPIYSDPKGLETAGDNTELKNVGISEELKLHAGELVGNIISAATTAIAIAAGERHDSPETTTTPAQNDSPASCSTRNDSAVTAASEGPVLRDHTFFETVTEEGPMTDNTDLPQQAATVSTATTTLNLPTSDSPTS